MFLRLGECSTLPRPVRSAGSRRRCAKPAANPLPAYDALIAASAIAHDLPLYTGNPADFTGIGELSVRAVPNPRPVDR
jgi:hypothetical protein